MTDDYSPADITATLEDQQAESDVVAAPDAPRPVSPVTLGIIEKSKSLVAPRAPGRRTLAMMMDVPVTLVMEVGRTKISVLQLMELVEGSIIDLRTISVDSIEVRMNDALIAQGEAVSMQQRYGIRFTVLESSLTLEQESGDE